MSRIGKLHITVPNGVSITLGDDKVVTVKGPKGEMKQQISENVTVEVKDGELVVGRVDETKECRSMHGLYRSLLNNMVIGVSEGFRKELELVGVVIVFLTLAKFWSYHLVFHTLSFFSYLKR